MRQDSLRWVPDRSAVARSAFARTASWSAPARTVAAAEANSVAPDTDRMTSTTESLFGRAAASLRLVIPFRAVLRPSGP
jgi:hypothetical protein